MSCPGSRSAPTSTGSQIPIRSLPHQADFHSRFHWETLAAWCSGVAGTLLAGTAHACGFWETL